MDNTDLHFLTFDPDEMYRTMMEIYVANGGTPVYPGDEKDMVLRGVQAILVQGFAAVDNALRMSTLRYASGEFLDLLGESRGCVRNAAAAAKAMVTMTFTKLGTLPAGTRMTADGKTFYVTTDDTISQTAMTYTVEVTAAEAGGDGNSLKSGTQMDIIGNYPDIKNVHCVMDAAGGTEAEDDESYRERIRQFGLTNNTTGPKMQYEAAAKAVSDKIIDAKAYRGTAACDVNIYLTIADDGDAGTLIANVRTALSDYNRRPLTDNVTVIQSQSIPYTLNVQYQVSPGSNIADRVTDAIEEYQKRQDGIIGEAFNPDKLMAAIYSAGATRVTWGTGSNFNGGAVEYTQIDSKKHCKGTITAEVMA